MFSKQGTFFQSIAIVFKEKALPWSSTKTQIIA